MVILWRKLKILLEKGIDCDEVFPNIILGNGCTVKKKDYLRKVGITHILNAAEYRGVNVGQDYFLNDANLIYTFPIIYF